VQAVDLLGICRALIHTTIGFLFSKSTVQHENHLISSTYSPYPEILRLATYTLYVTLMYTVILLFIQYHFIYNCFPLVF